MVQFVGFFGAIGFQWVAAIVGATRAILASLVLWTATILYIYAWVTSAKGFFLAAAVVAIVMGGSQALSRSLFAQLIPKGREAEYFSIYEISDKGTSWLCPLRFRPGPAIHAQLPPGVAFADHFLHRRDSSCCCG